MAIKVVSGLLFQPDGTLFLQKRGHNREFGGFWESPGGKVDDGETMVDALIREFREELGAKDVKVHPRSIMSMAFIPPHNLMPADIHFFLVELPGRQTLSPREDQQELSCKPLSFLLNPPQGEKVLRSIKTVAAYIAESGYMNFVEGFRAYQ